MDECLVKIYESEGIARVWLQDKLEEENIPYKVDSEKLWTNARDIHTKQYIFVDVRHEKLAKSIIDEYNSIDFSIHEDDEFSSDFKNELPQIICPACGEKIDLDYPKCPFCQHELPVTEYYEFNTLE